jgi:hypothetical protein
MRNLGTSVGIIPLQQSFQFLVTRPNKWPNEHFSCRNIVYLVVLAATTLIIPPVVNSALVVRGANFTTLTAEARRMSFDAAFEQKINF